MSSAKPSGEGVEPRRAALRILDRIFRSGQTVESASWVAEKLSPADQSLAIAIVGETLRRIPEVDSLIDGATRLRLPDDSKARMVLRIALAQRLVMSVPDHAVVATALPLVEGGPRRLVHGVLGTLLRGKLAASAAPRLAEEVERRWTRAWGADVVAAARRQIVGRPALDLSFADAGEAEDYAAAHDGVSLAPNHVRLESQSVADLAGFGEGRFWVQDLAASLPARLIPPNTRSVLDLCAAPGGKTMQLAAAGHRVLALDRSENRLARLADNLRRTSLEAKVEVEVADAFTWEAPGKFDAILIDAPCSATGTFRRHPEVLHRVRASFIHEAADAQLRLLTRAARWIEPGGSLVYSVCSLEPEEGEQVIRAFLDAHADFRLEPPPGIAAWLEPKPEGWVRLLPGLLAAQGGVDGFFIAHLVRNR